MQPPRWGGEVRATLHHSHLSVKKLDGNAQERVTPICRVKSAVKSVSMVGPTVILGWSVETTRCDEVEGGGCREKRGLVASL